jgi:hypothetical protein
MGKGPVFYYDCTTEKDCMFEVIEGVTFNDSKIYNYSSMSYVVPTDSKYTAIKSFVYTSMKPIVPEYMSY